MLRRRDIRRARRGRRGPIGSACAVPAPATAITINAVTINAVGSGPCPDVTSEAPANGSAVQLRRGGSNQLWTRA